MNRFTSEDGKVSGTKTMLSIFFILVCLKYLASNISVGSFSVGDFDGMGAAAILTALSLGYTGRRATEAWKQRGGENGED